MTINLQIRLSDLCNACVISSIHPLIPLKRSCYSQTDLTGFHAHYALCTEHRDSLEKVLILPPERGFKRIHRRLDLIFAAPESYWATVIGW